jgi:hypothetical protein
VLIIVAVVLGIALLANGFGDNGDTDDGRGPVGPGETTVEETTTTSEPAPPATHAPAQVKVWVLNASGQQGVAGDNTAKLIAAGFATNAAANAPDTPVSVVYHVPEYEGDAAVVATTLGLVPTAVAPMPSPPPVPNGDLQGSQLLVVLGADYQTTATTAAPAN